MDKLDMETKNIVNHNIDVLSDVINLSLTNVEREKKDTYLEKTFGQSF